MDLVTRIRNSVIGRDVIVDTPFGPRRVTYADYTASGRSLEFVEDFIRDRVLPMYANTHTETSGTGLQTTRFREEAREEIRRGVGAIPGEHAVLFVGSGATGAVDRMIRVLGLRIPSRLEGSYHFGDSIPPERRPAVFVGPYEHHSNELPWRETIADVIEIEEDGDGRIDLNELAGALDAHAERPLLIGSFSAASNVTGIISDIEGVSTLLHSRGALSFWDFAASAPHVAIRMGSPGDGGAYMDAIFLSPHKFIGGPGTPGVLVARRDLLENEVPTVPGGGTVQYVNRERHTYLDDIEHREEGGTPAIVESIRAGLVFRLKGQVGPDRIRALEDGFVRRAIEAWAGHPSIRILGNPEEDRLSIVSFVIDHGERILHHNFVVALLNDLFGIQARGGCSCAGPYGHRLLGIDADTSARFERVIAAGCELIKPGWVRLNFNYFISEEEFAYIVEAVLLIASHGWRLLPLYTYEPDSAIWRHRDGLPHPPAGLADADFDSLPTTPRRAGIESLSSQLDEARELLAGPLQAPTDCPELSIGAEELRWFPKPEEVTT